MLKDFLELVRLCEIDDDYDLLPEETEMISFIARDFLKGYYLRISSLSETETEVPKEAGR
jgi:hypothetical protein